MKKYLYFLSTLFVMTCISIPAKAFDYNITFTGSGASTTVDSVVVQNLSKSTQVTVHGGTQLRLTDVISGINELHSIADLAFVYPNPITGNATYTFTAKYAGKTQIAIFGLDGRKVAGLDADLQQGNNSFLLALPTGVFLVQAIGNGFSYTTKTISLSMNTSKPKISYSGNTTYSKPKRAPASEIKFLYSTGDQLLYKGYSGNYCTIVTDKPTSSKTTDFIFVECRDADGNNYAVVHIGTQTWMAENLKTTKYRNGEAIPNVTGNSTWGALNTGAWCNYNNNAANGTKYGRIYNWYAATDSRNIAPVGWHVPTDAEWTTFENYLIANGFSYDGSTTGIKIAKALAATTDWNTSTSGGVIGNDLTKNNSSGFTALPCGYRDNNGTFNNIWNEGFWWSSSVFDTDAWYRKLTYYLAFLSLNIDSKSKGFSVRCVLSASTPFVTTAAVSNITQTTATLGGYVTSEGGSTVTARGVCWSTSQNPTTANSKTSNGAGTGDFTSTITGLTVGTTYYVRAYAINSNGTAYGNQVSFKTVADITVPVVVTLAASEITNTTAQIGGSITSDGGSLITASGMCWNTTGNPTIANSKTNNVTGTSVFLTILTGLKETTTYYFRAYATNIKGTSYGEVKSFSTPDVRDIDGNLYHTVTIGTQTWLVENLKTTRYRNGDAIGTTKNDQNLDYPTKNISTESEPKYQWAFSGNENNVGELGRLYTWYAATDARNIAPAGWHVPTDAEWQTLLFYLILNGYNYDGSTTTENKIAKALAATTGWETYFETGTIGYQSWNNNSSGFSALPGGFRSQEGTFYHYRSFGYWWSSTTSNPGTTYALNRFLHYASINFDGYRSGKKDGLSVRCLRD